MTRDPDEIQDAPSHTKGRARAILRSDPGEAYSVGELCGTIGVDSIADPAFRSPLIHPFDYKKKTDLSGVKWYYAKPNWFFWLALGGIAFIAGFGLTNLLDSAGLPRMVASILAVIPFLTVMVAYQKVIHKVEIIAGAKRDLKSLWEWLRW